MIDRLLKIATRQRLVLAWLAAACCASVMAQPTSSAMLPTPQSLQEALSKAMQQKQPLVVMVSLDGCPFCREARQSHLVPMQKAGFPIVQLDMRSAQVVSDFQGRATTHDQLIKQWRISIAPTLLFFGPGGKEAAERMEGGYLPDFYGPYLGERLAKARQSL
jgi:thioredoxin-related protein